ncbi:hypothetical protein [Mycobacterium sp. MS1601]|uniref:hypothetical protein n=1 Tax=Mycobacterium sp. MS1601 TaxID=1936029 RepID=UPI00178CD13C|nr:hypothetical protein [Mycobacterium sp. MS1601]
MTICAGASVWFNAVIRAEEAPIWIGPGTSVQVGAVLDTEVHAPLHIGAGVALGHNATCTDAA